MENFIDAVRKAIKDENWYGALFIALTLPDICVKIETGTKTSRTRYAKWFERHLPNYKTYLLGKDCYSLRCALLHEGLDDITGQSYREILDHFIFITSSGAHSTLFKDCIINGKKESLLQLSVDTFCEDICKAVEAWLQVVSSDKIIKQRLTETIKIHEPGYNYGGIKFS